MGDHFLMSKSKNFSDSISPCRKAPEYKKSTSGELFKNSIFTPLAPRGKNRKKFFLNFDKSDVDRLFSDPESENQSRDGEKIYTNTHGV